MKMDNPFQEQIREGWKIYQNHLVAAIAPLTTDQLAFEISPDLRSIMTVAAHIVSARVW